METISPGLKTRPFRRPADHEKITVFGSAYSTEWSSPCNPSCGRIRVRRTSTTETSAPKQRAAGAAARRVQLAGGGKSAGKVASTFCCEARPAAVGHFCCKHSWAGDRSVPPSWYLDK